MIDNQFNTESADWLPHTFNLTCQHNHEDRVTQTGLSTVHMDLLANLRISL